MAHVYGTQKIRKIFEVGRLLNFSSKEYHVNFSYHGGLWSDTTIDLGTADCVKPLSEQSQLIAPAERSKFEDGYILLLCTLSF